MGESGFAGTFTGPVKHRMPERSFELLTVTKNGFSFSYHDFVSWLVNDTYIHTYIHDVHEVKESEMSDSALDVWGTVRWMTPSRRVTDTTTQRHNAHNNNRQTWWHEALHSASWTIHLIWPKSDVLFRMLNIVPHMWGAIFDIAHSQSDADSNSYNVRCLVGDAEYSASHDVCMWAPGNSNVMNWVMRYCGLGYYVAIFSCNAVS